MEIPGVMYSSVSKHILIFNELTYHNVKFKIHHTKTSKNEKIITDTSKGHADWLIDNLFNGGEKYRHTNTNGVEFEHYNDYWEWSPNKRYSLIFTGSLKHRIKNSQNPWQLTQ